MKAMKRELLTVFEACRKFKVSGGYLRLHLGKSAIKGDLAHITKTRQIWLIDGASLKSFLKSRRPPGRPPKR